MGMETIVYGVIEGAHWKSPDYERLQLLNREVISTLPLTDKWPFLTRGMFHINESPKPFGTYRTELITFGASFKEVELEWMEWLEKFENLLRRLYWYGVSLHLQAENGNGFWNYSYAATDISAHFFESEPPLPVASWIFEGGPREF